MFFCTRKSLIHGVLGGSLLGDALGYWVCKKNKKNADLHKVGEREDTEGWAGIQNVLKIRPYKPFEAEEAAAFPGDKKVSFSWCS